MDWNTYKKIVFENGITFKKMDKKVIFIMKDSSIIGFEDQYRIVKLKSDWKLR